MDTNNIFISQSEINDNDIAGKITYTDIISSIPEGKVEKQIIDWKKKYNTEWRWRFLRFNVINQNSPTKKEIEKYVVEISYIKNNSDERMYFNRHGEWVKRKIDPYFDKYVEKQYFVYN